MKNRLLIFSVISLLIIFLYPSIRNNFLVKQCNLNIQTLNDKNTDAKGTEVWIDSISVDGEIIPNNSIKLTDGWEVPNRLFSAGNGSFELLINFEYKDSIVITFITHPYSGKIKIKNDEKEEVIDLYSKSQDILVYEIK